MASYRICDFKTLIVIVFGLLTTAILGLGIWRAVIRIQEACSFKLSKDVRISPSPDVRHYSNDSSCLGGNVSCGKKGSLSSPPNIPTDFCKNGGTWMGGKCICPEEWKGLRCTIINYCEKSTYGEYAFDRIPVGRYGQSLQTCDRNTLNAGKPRASRLCSFSVHGAIALGAVRVGNCNETLQTLEELIKSSNNTNSYETISTEAQILTSVASQLTAKDINSAANVATELLNATQNISSEAKELAVTTVSQLLDASEDVFKEASDLNKNILTTLIEQVETYSLSLDNQSVVQPNIAIQSVDISNETVGESTSVRFSVQEGSSNFLNPDSTYVERNQHGLEMTEQTSLQILLSTSNSNVTTYGFVVYQNNKLFQSKTFTASSNFSQKIISGKTGGNKEDKSTPIKMDLDRNRESENNQDTFVEMAFRPKYNPKEFQIHSYACVYWNFLKSDWDTYGCHKGDSTEKFLRCRCNHTTNFAVLMSFRKNINYPDSLNNLSTAGCALSITGLALTIIFQIVTRNVRKSSVTWVLVSLCSSMLIFNLLFVFGIENSNKDLKNEGNENKDNEKNTVPPSDNEPPSENPTCTVVAALLHYFLLTTLTWTGLSAMQLYFLLIRTMRPFPRCFTLLVSLIGWGIPAVVVAMTVGITYALSENKSRWDLKYRQEEICWLETSIGGNIAKSPLLWSFFMPVTIILISNVIIFIIITVKVFWKNNQNLTSTKKFSSFKKILNTLSIAVIFGITWITAYLMMFENNRVPVFSYIFCLFNSTQGLQIFILHTVRTKIFQSEALKVLTWVLSTAQRVKLKPPTMTPPRMRLRMYNMLRAIPALNERFRLLEPSVYTEETTLSESSQTDLT